MMGILPEIQASSALLQSPALSGPPAARLHYLDHMRGILMMLGILIHSARIFSTRSWVVWDAQNTTVLMDYIVYFVHAFRMPAFFVVSGFLFARSCRSRAGMAVLRSRLQRIGVPLIVTFLTVNTIQLLILRSASGSAKPLLAYLSEKLLDGTWLGHLWFLVYLMGYMVVALRVESILRRVPDDRNFGPTVLFCAPACVVALHVIGKAAPVLWVSVAGLSAMSWLDLLPYYLVGFMLPFRPRAMSHFAQWTMTCSVALAAAIFTAYNASASTGWTARAIQIYSTGVIAWCGVIACFALSIRFLSSPSKVLRNVADSSYSVYLLHHIVVVVVGSFMVTSNWPVAVEFTAVVAVALGCTLLAHRVIAKTPALLYAFNGRTAKPESTPGLKPESKPQLKAMAASA